MKELDCFIVLEKGGKWAMQYIEEHPVYLQDTIFSERKRNYFHYSPPITVGWGIKKRKNHITNSTSNIFGSLQEENFEKRGEALIIDDQIDTGLTLNFARKFLFQKGYSPGEIFVFGKENHGILKIERLSHYEEKMKRTDENLCELVNFL